MPSRFNLHPSSIYRQAVNACRALLQAEGDDGVRRAYAESTTNAIRDGYLRFWRLKPSRSDHVCVQRLKGERCPDDLSHLKLRGADHLSEWTDGKKTVLIVSQPYHLHYETLEQVVAFCQANGLRADVEAESAWHFPGATLLITFKREKKNG